jgi:putative sigma-54 modulation protein
MISNISVTGIHYDVSSKMERYVRSKIGRLDRYMPRGARRSVRAEVRLIEDKGNRNDKYQAEVVLHIKNGNLTAKESTLNMYAAIDIVEAKLKNQLRKHKEKHMDHRRDRKGVMRRLRRMADRDFWGSQN